MSQIFLRPGDYFFGQHEGQVTTLLGSCVAIILWHPRWRLLAMSHYLLPSDPTAQAPHDTRYGEGVFQRIHADMLRHGTRPAEYRKGIFGGGSLITTPNNNATTSNSSAARRVGRNNADFARQQFSLRNWSIDLCDLNGDHYRRLNIDGVNGSVQCQRNRVQISPIKRLRP